MLSPTFARLVSNILFVILNREDQLVRTAKTAAAIAMPQNRPHSSAETPEAARAFAVSPDALMSENVPDDIFSTTA